MSDERNYAADMRAAIDAETADGPYTAPGAAATIVAKLQANDPDLLDGWLHAHAVALVRDAIAARDASRRAYARHQHPRSVFADAARAFADGDETAMLGFLTAPYVVNPEGLRKPLAMLTREEVLFVADDYHRTEREAALEAAFMRAVAKKVPEGVTVGEVFDEGQLVRLRESITRRAAPAEPTTPAVPVRGPTRRGRRAA